MSSWSALGLALAALMTSCTRARRSTTPPATTAERAIPDPGRSTVTIETGGRRRDGEVVANGIDSARIDVQLRTVEGRALRAWPVRVYPELDGIQVAADRMQTESLITDDDGRVAVTIRSTVAGRRAIRVVVEPGLGLPSVQLHQAPTMRFVGDASNISTAETQFRVVGATTVLASGAVPAQFAVTVRDARGNSIPDIEVNFVPGAGASSKDRLTIADSRTDPGGVVRAELRTTAVGARRWNAFVRRGDGEPLSVGSVEFEFVGDGLAAGDRRALVGRPGTLEMIDFRAATSTTTAGTPLGTIELDPIHIVTAHSPTRPFEQLALSLTRADLGTELRARRWTGTAWAFDWSVPFIPLDAVDPRGFTLAYEQDAGDSRAPREQALAVYTDGFRTPRYRVFDGFQWSGEAILPLNDGPGLGPDTNDGSVRWIELAARPNSEQIALGFVDSAGSLVVVLWDGDDWRQDTAIRLADDLHGDGSSVAASFRAFDLVFDAAGALHVAWGARNTVGTWHTRLGVDGVWDVPVRFGGITPHFLDLAAAEEPDGGVARVVLQLDGIALGGAPRPVAAEFALRPTTQLWQVPQRIDTTATTVPVAGAAPAAIAFVDGTATCFLGDAGLVRIEHVAATNTWLRHGPWTTFGNPVHLELHGGTAGRAFGIALTNDAGELLLGIPGATATDPLSPRTVATGLPVANRRAFAVSSR